MPPTAQQKRLGVGTSCTVSVRFLHPKNKVKEVIHNQTASQKLSGLIVQGKEEKTIRKAGKECIVFRHEDFGGQLIWALQRYVSIDVEGPLESFFEAEGGAAAVAPTGEAQQPQQAQQQAQQQQQQQAQQNDVEEELPAPIQEVIGRGNLDNDDAAAAAAAAPMVDDDNKPAPENRPQLNEAVGDIFSEWGHSGICARRSTIRNNPKPEMKFWKSSEAEPSNLDLFEGFFFSAYIKTTILPKTNNNLHHGHDQLQYGEFLQWLGLWLLMSTMVGPQRHEYWAAYPINAFRGAPLRLGVWMSRAHFDAILAALSFTDRDPPPFVDKFWEVRQMIDAWGSNMNNAFAPGYMNCLDESMSVWTNKFTCPGFMFVPRKPWPFGNEYHTVCCCLSGIMWGIDLVEGKDRPRQLGQLQYDKLGSMVGLLL